MALFRFRIPMSRGDKARGWQSVLDINMCPTSIADYDPLLDSVTYSHVSHSQICHLTIPCSEPDQAAARSRSHKAGRLDELPLNYVGHALLLWWSYFEGFRLDSKTSPFFHLIRAAVRYLAADINTLC